MKEHQTIYEPSPKSIWYLRGDGTYHLRPEKKRGYGRFYSLNTPVTMIIIVGRTYPKALQIDDVNNWGRKQRVLLANGFKP